jgi:hypothetical protein
MVQFHWCKHFHNVLYVMGSPSWGLASVSFLSPFEIEGKMVAWCLKHNAKIFAYGDVFPYGTQLQLLEDGGRGT